MTATTPATTRRRIPLPSFGAQILLALVLGLALGYLARTAQLDWLTNTLDTVGSLFVQLLKLAVPPLVFTAIVASIVQLQHLKNAARLAAATLGWFAVSGLIAVGTSIGLGLLTMAIGLLPLLLLRWRLNVLTLGDDEARTMGINVRRLRLQTMLSSSPVR